MVRSRSSAARTWEVFTAFLRLGLTSFGGPVAHLGYFRSELVERRRWVRDSEYADLVALCQFLPGPASSQVGFGLGLHRAGAWGALAAFVAFTLPSAALMVLFAYGAALVSGPVGEGVIAGLKVVAVAIVAHAVMGMARSLAPDRSRASIAVAAAVLALVFAGSIGQVAAIAVGALAGLAFLRGADHADAGRDQADVGLRFPVSRTVGGLCLLLGSALLIAGPAVAAWAGSDSLTLADAFYRSGALVFGGGHVVLPLLQGEVVATGWVPDQDFLAGYGMAQAMPGPLFTFAAYLGAVSQAGPGGVLGAVIALVAIFLPGLLLLTGVLPFWNAVRSHERARALMRGANAAVVGILGAALYTPVFTSGITGAGSFGLGLVCFVLLTALKLPAWAVVIVGALGGLLLETFPRAGGLL